MLSDARPVSIWPVVERRLIEGANEPVAFWRTPVAYTNRKTVAEIERWKDAPLWDRESIALATQTWFQYLGSRDR